MSIYPAQIDDSTTLPVVINTLTPVSAEVVNALRNAIIAIEQTMGVNPAGVYGTVRARLDFLEALIVSGGGGGGGGGSPTGPAGGNLGGTFPSPIVISIQNHAVSSSNPSDGQVLTWSTTDNQWEPKTPSSGFIAGGDLIGSSTNQTLNKIQGHTVSANSPSDGDVLTYVTADNQWEPKPSTGGSFTPGGDLSGSSSSQTISKLQGNTLTVSAPSKSDILTFNGSSFINRADDYLNILDYGGNGNGVADNTTAFANASTAAASHPSGKIYIPAGTYLLSSTQSISGNLVFAQGALIKPTAAITITLSGQIEANGYQQIFDISADGYIMFTAQSDCSICWFGADPLGVRDSTDSIQAALNSYSSFTPQGFPQNPTVRTGRGQFIVSKPIRLEPDNISLIGEGTNATTFFTPNSTLFGGPMFIMSAPQLPFPTTIGILTSGVSGLLNPSLSPYSVNLRDGGLCELDGFSTLTMELFIKIDPSFIGSSALGFGSSGALFNGIQGDEAIRFNLQPIGSQWSLDSKITTSVTGPITSGGSSTLINAGTLYHLALVYDGTHAKMYINGTADSNVISATGTIVQKIWESISLGFVAPFFPRAASEPSWKGAIDSIRFSKIARYTTNFTPPADKLPFDINTIMLVNFDKFDHRCIIVDAGRYAEGYGGQWKAYLPTRYSGTLGGGGTNQLLKGIHLEAQSTLFFMEGGVNSTIEDINGSGGDGGYLDSNCYYSKLSKINITMGRPNRCGLYYFLSGIHECRDVQITSGGIAIAADQSSIGFENVTHISSTQAVGSIFVRGSASITLRDFFIDNESASLRWLGGLLLDSNQFPTVIVGGAIDMGASSSGVPCILINPNGSNNPILAYGVDFGPAPSSSIIKTLSILSNNALIRFDGCVQNGGNAGVPWGDTNTPTTINGNISRKIISGSSSTANNWDQTIGINVSSAYNITLPSNPNPGQYIIIKDQSGNADINNITITANSGQTIDGISTFVIFNKRGSVKLTYDGTSDWMVT